MRDDFCSQPDHVFTQLTVAGVVGALATSVTFRKKIHKICAVGSWKVGSRDSVIDKNWCLHGIEEFAGAFGAACIGFGSVCIVACGVAKSDCCLFDCVH